MRLARIKLGYDLRESFPAWAKDALLAAIVSDPVFGDNQYVPEFKAIEGKEDVVAFEGWWTSVIVDIDKMPQIPFEIVGMSQLIYRTVADVRESGGAAPINERVNVMIPGNFLSEVTDVKVVYDFCTDMLGDEIKNGWRILAICPQPDQRRPDYVLGKKA
jgi:hypothetical protein